jgi:enamine deaminase RidA (YjgF/YER057c/UK114 family)
MATMSHEVLLPPGWPRPKGYSNGIAATGRQVYVAGQIGWNAQCQFVTDRFSAQVRQALENVVAVLAQAGASAEHVVRLTWFITSRDEYLGEIAEVGAAYRDVFGRNFPAMSVVEVTALMEARAKVEI